MDDLAKYSFDYTYIPFIPTQPLDAFEQLLGVLPPQSNKLLPAQLRKLMVSELSPLYPYYPKHFEIDVSGKRAEWEAIAILPVMDLNLLREAYKDMVKYVPTKEKRLARKLKPVHYVKCKPYDWKSYYGTVKNCKVKYKILV